MQINVRAINLEIDWRTRADVEDRLRSGLARLSHQIQRVEARLLDQNGPRGGNDIACAAEIHLRPAGRVFIEARDATLKAVVNGTAGKAQCAVKRYLQRKRQARRLVPRVRGSRAAPSAESRLD